MGRRQFPRENVLGMRQLPGETVCSLFSRERTGELGCQFSKERFVVAGFSTPGQEPSLLCPKLGEEEGDEK